MKPAPFLYSRVATVDEALAVLAEHGDEAKVLAGGQSLIPMLNFRLARPGVLVDVTRIPELGRIERRNGTLVVGAAVPQAEAEHSAMAAEACPMLVQALHHVGHPQIRARGTVGGSLAHADASAELAAVALALDATLVVRGPAGERTVPAASFFIGPWMTTIKDDELLTEVRLPALSQHRTAFVELARRSGDFAVVGLAVAVRMDPETHAVADARLAAIGVGGCAQRLHRAEQVLGGQAVMPGLLTAAGEAAAAEVDPPSDRVKGDADYRRQVLFTLVRRSLVEAAQ